MTAAADPRDADVARMLAQSGRAGWNGVVRPDPAGGDGVVLVLTSPDYCPTTRRGRMATVRGPSLQAAFDGALGALEDGKVPRTPEDGPGPMTREGKPPRGLPPGCRWRPGPHGLGEVVCTRPLNDTGEG